MLNNPLELKVTELVGLEKGEYGRTCGLHAYCGQQVVPGTVLKLHFAEISILEEIHQQIHPGPILAVVPCCSQ